MMIFPNGVKYVQEISGFLFDEESLFVVFGSLCCIVFSMYVDKQTSTKTRYVSNMCKQNIDG